MKLNQADRQRIVDLCRRLKPHWTSVKKAMHRQYGLNVSARTCERTWRRWQQKHTIADRLRSGRPRKCTVQQEGAIRKRALCCRFGQIKEYCEMVRREMGVSLSTSMRNLLKRHSLLRRVAVKKPLLTENARGKRRLWAQNHQNWKIWKWKNVFFSDEKIFRGNSNRRTLYVTRRPGEKFAKECIQPTVKHTVQIHVWGTAGWNGLGPLKLVNGKLNAQKYREEILNDIREICQSLVPRKAKPVFQQDLAPAHSARATLRYLDAQGMSVLAWPGNSPDMNLIENVWALVASRMSKHANLPQNTAELWDRVQRAWASISIEEVRKLFRSMPSRVHELLAKNGGPTHY